jgi:hypothetical protein
MKSTLKRILGGLFTVLLFALPVLGFVFRQQIFDWWQLRGYSPSSQIRALVREDTMTPAAERVFYVNHPKISAAKEFNEHCNIKEFSIVLGCYSKTGGIYVYKVTDKRLDGIIQVTAAHELLHAEYDRLSKSEREEINSQLLAVFKKLDNPRLNNTIKQYQDQDPSSVPNELHSILGTEVRDLPPALEKHYKQYFKDRSKIVDYSDQYEKEFTSRQNQVAAYDKQLTVLRAQIDANQAELKLQLQDLNAQRSRLASMRGSSSTDEYNALVAEFNSDVSTYNGLAAKTKVEIEEYNALVRKRNSLASEVQSLTEAIDSTPERFH